MTKKEKIRKMKKIMGKRRRQTRLATHTKRYKKDKPDSERDKCRGRRNQKMGNMNEDDFESHFDSNYIRRRKNNTGGTEQRQKQIEHRLRYSNRR